MAVPHCSQNVWVISKPIKLTVRFDDVIALNDLCKLDIFELQCI